MFSLESPHRGDANEYTQYSIFNMNKKDTINYPKSAAMGFFFPRDSRMSSKRAISVRVIEVLLYIVLLFRKFITDSEAKIYQSIETRQILLY